MIKVVKTNLDERDFPIDGNFPFGNYLYRKFGTGYTSKRVNNEYIVGALEFLRANGELIQDSYSVSLASNKEESDKEFFYGAWYLYKGNLINIASDSHDRFNMNFWTGVSLPFVIEEFNQFIAPPRPVLERVATMSLLMATKHDGPQFFEFAAPLQDVNIALNYGEKFTEVNSLIQQKLSENKSGLYIFRGPPGTGKSTYIKYLSQVVDREILLIPNNMGHLLADPQFLSLLVHKQGSIIVLEDAEKVIQDRSVDSNSPVSSLLNLTDGFLGNVLNIAIILTFNCDKQHIDKALLRKGRLAFDYEFKKLPVNDAQNLLNHLKVDHNATEPMSLADIFFIHDKVEVE